MIMFIGDVHGDFAVFSKLREYLNPDAPITIIQVGDFGFHSEVLKNWKELPWPVYVICGNHEDYRLVNTWKTITEVKPNLFYVPRGTVKKIDGFNIGFVGGGSSLDKYWRVKGESWFEEENITPEQISPLVHRNDLDILVTHTPPSTIIKAHFPKLNLQAWNLPKDWIDHSANQIEFLWSSMPNRPYLICGHMHRSILGFGYRILDINEIICMREKKDGETSVNVSQCISEGNVRTNNEDY